MSRVTRVNPNPNPPGSYTKPVTVATPVSTATTQKQKEESTETDPEIPPSILHAPAYSTAHLMRWVGRVNPEPRVRLTQCGHIRLLPPDFAYR